MTDYLYTQRDLLEIRQHYHYTALQGPSFLKAYREARMAVLAELPNGTAHPLPAPHATLPDGTDGPIETRCLLDALERDPDPRWTARLVQRFEVTKRLYEQYDRRLRAGSGACDDLSLYARLGALIAGGGAGPDNLAALSTLLKLNDLLCSQSATRRATVAAWLRPALRSELAAVAALTPASEGMSDA